MKKILTLVTLALLVFACGPDDEPSRAIFTFTLKNDFYHQYNSETWIVVRDGETGELIDSRQVEGKDPLVFESNKPISAKGLSITLLRVYTVNTNKNIYANVYNGIGEGSNWVVDYKGANVPLPVAPSGGFDFTIDGLPILESFSISDKHGEFGVDVTYTDQVIDGAFQLHVDAPKQLITVDVGEKSKYVMLEDVENGDVLDLHYSDFQDFDKYVRVDFPATEGASAFMKAFSTDEKSNYVFYRSQVFGEETRDNIQLGFLDDFTNYEISIYAFPWTYYSKGAAPTSIQHNNAAAFGAFRRNTIQEYTLTSTASYLYSTCGYFQYEQAKNTSTAIHYFDPAGSPKHHDPFTDEIVAKYSIPMIGLLQGVTTVVTDGDDSYEKQINLLFDPNFEFVLTKRVSVELH